MKKWCVVANVVCVLSGVGIAAGQTQSQAPAKNPANSPTVNVGSAVAAKAANPAPSPNAKNQSQQRSIGQGMTKMKASEPSAYWTDLVDVDDDGQVEDNQFLLDKKRGILYTYRYDNFQCADGTASNGDVLMGIYTQGNTAGMPVGAGWFVVGLTPGQCGEKKGGTYGCKFDAKGNLKPCGPAKIHEDSGELEVSVKK
jgi:hypothetical protein